MAIRYASKALNDEGKVEVTVREAGVSTTNKDVERVLDWRSKNPDKYRAYMKAYMAKRRKK